MGFARVPPQEIIQPTDVFFAMSDEEFQQFYEKTGLPPTPTAWFMELKDDNGRAWWFFKTPEERDEAQDLLKGCDSIQVIVAGDSYDPVPESFDTVKAMKEMYDL